MKSIIFRYLNREVLTTLLALTVVLLVIIVTGRVSKYLTLASKGEVNSEILFWLIWYRLPEFLQLILPLGLFLGVLLSLGRMYVDNEITTLLACGVSLKQIAINLLGSVVAVSLVVGWISIWVAPESNGKMNLLWQSQDSSAMEFDALVSGRFQSQANSTRTVYSETLSADKKQLGNVFIAQKSEAPKSKKNKTANNNESLMIIVAESATQQIKPETGDRFLILNNGYRYDGTPGKLDYRQMQFSAYGVRVAHDEAAGSMATSIKSTAELWKSKEPKDRAELQWRLSLPMVVPILALLALTLSKVQPRQGRFAKLLPAFCVYLFYVLLLVGMRTMVRSESWISMLGLWWVHILFLILAIILFKWEQLLRWLNRRSYVSKAEGVS